MKRAFLFGCLLFLWTQSIHALQVPDADRERIEKSVRKALSVIPNWQIRLLEVSPSSFTGLYQGNLEFKSGENTRFQNILLSKDFKQYIIGNVYNSEEDSDAARMKMINLKGSPSRGPADAPVTIVEFSDLQCPSCKYAHEKLKQDKIVEGFPGKVRLVFKSKPAFQSHDWALPAAVAALCAYRQDPRAFWSMVDDIYVHQSSITASNLWENLSAYAKAAKLKPAAFKKCFDNKETMDLIKADLSEAEALGAVQTPTFFINGRVLVGYPNPEPFRALIAEFLNKK